MAKVRRRKVISSRDEKKILQGLEHHSEGREISALRLRAFVYILWDGAIRSKTVLGLNIEEVVSNRSARRIRAVERVKMRACEANRHRQITFALGKRTRIAIEEYLQVARQDSWLPSKRLEGPLFLSTQDKGGGRRMSARTPHNIWRSFLADYIDERLDYGLDDIVLTGRAALLKAAGGDAKALAAHADLHPDTATRYQALIPCGRRRG